MQQHSDSSARSSWNPDYRFNRTAMFFGGLCLGAIYIVCDLHGHGQQGVGAGVAAGMILLTMRIHWNHRHYAWYWTGILFALLLQIPFVKFFPPVNKSATLATVLPMMLLDYPVIYCLLRLAYGIDKKLGAQRGGMAPS